MTASGDRHLPETSSQTAGPYLHLGCFQTPAIEAGGAGADLASFKDRSDTSGEHIVLNGHVFDGLGIPIVDAMLEFWQADANGLYPSPEERRGTAAAGFSGWARRACDPDTGLWQLETIRPGTLANEDGTIQAPHIAVWIAARGIGLALYTRLYFNDDERNASDPLLCSILPARRRGTLMASEIDGIWRFDIHLQGDQETVFIHA